MTSQGEKVTVYSGHRKNPIVIPEGEHHITKTDLSSNNDNRWPEGSPSKRELRKLIVSSEIRHERKPEPSHRYHKRTESPERWNQRVLRHPVTKLDMRGTRIQ